MAIWTPRPPYGTAIDRSHPLAQGLVALWPLGEGAGLPADALTGVRAASCSAAWTQSAAGPALAFDGTSQSVGLGSTPWLSIAGPFTVAAAAAPTSAANFPVVYGGYQDGGSFAGLAMAVNTGQIKVWTGSSWQAFAASAQGLQVYAASLSSTAAGGLAAYFRGLPVGTATDSYPAAWAGVHALGSVSDAANNFYAGQLAWVGVWRRALTAAEHAAIGATPTAIFDILFPGPRPTVVIFGAGASVFSVSGSGGAILGGSAILSASFAPSASGGAVAGGSAAPSAAWSVAGSGGAVAGGVASATATWTVTTAGGAVLGGSASGTLAGIWSYVRGNGNASSGNVASLSTSLTGVTPGNLLVIGACSNAGTTLSVSDSGGNTWSPGPTVNFGTTSQPISLFYCNPTTGGSLTFTLTPSASSTLTMAVDEYHCATGSWSADGNSTGTDGGTLGTTLSTGAITPTGTDLIVAVGRLQQNHGTNIYPWTAGTGFTLTYAQTGGGGSADLAAEYQLNVTGAVTPSMSGTGNATNWGMVAAAFKSSGSTHSVTGSGGAVVGGSSAPSASWSITASGGAVGGGSSVPSAVFSASSSGGPVVGGSAQGSSNSIFTVTAAGGPVLGGGVTLAATFAPTATGGVVIGGLFDPEAIFSLAGSGGPVVGGSAQAANPSTQTFRKALRAKLLTIADLTAIVGTAVYPGAIPQTHDLQRDGPALTYTIVKLPRGMAGLHGVFPGHALSGSDGTITARVELSAWSFNVSDVDDISVILFQNLDGIRNATDWGDGTTTIVSCVRGPEFDLPTPAQTGRGGIIFHIACEYDIKYRVSIPVLN